MLYSCNRIFLKNTEGNEGHSSVDKGLLEMLLNVIDNLRTHVRKSM